MNNCRKGQTEANSDWISVDITLQHHKSEQLDGWSQIISKVISGSFDIRVTLSINFLLPIYILLIIIGMYVLNNLFDDDCDRINEKIHRPLPSGKVTKGHAITFVVLMNVIGLAIPIFLNTLMGIVLASTMALIGILYSLPKVSLKDKFIIKICAIGIVMKCSLLLGASIYWQENFMMNLGITFRWIKCSSSRSDDITSFFGCNA